MVLSQSLVAAVCAFSQQLLAILNQVKSAFVSSKCSHVITGITEISVSAFSSMVPAGSRARTARTPRTFRRPRRPAGAGWSRSPALGCSCTFSRCCPRIWWAALQLIKSTLTDPEKQEQLSACTHTDTRTHALEQLCLYEICLDAASRQLKAKQMLWTCPVCPQWLCTDVV